MYKPKKLIRKPRTRLKNRMPLEREIRRLQDEMLSLGSFVSRSILESVEILRNQDLTNARILIAADEDVNRRRYAIEDAGLKLIATQNPLAGDLRTIAAILEIATELERISDYAKGIAKIAITIGTEPLVYPMPELPRMAVKAQGMLRRALFAFTERDVALAHAIALQDDEVDSLYQTIYMQIMQTIINDPFTVENANYLLWVAHNLERTGDRSLNICERVIFTVTGKLVDLDDQVSEN